MVVLLLSILDSLLKMQLMIQENSTDEAKAAHAARVNEIFAWLDRIKADVDSHGSK